MIILGLDPGTVATGYGAVIFEQGCLHLERCGVWRPPDGPLPTKLNFLSVKLLALLEDLHPVAVSVETVFAAKNVASTVKLSHARGVLLAAAARHDIPVFEYEPRLVKKALVGYGGAEKPQVRAMVLTLLARQRDRVPLDAADALAVAICHVHACPREP
ncbi:MAG TPA: crossover junction endodeoxyribonuclease RuvC [Thermoanaerobaculia bacterium]|nr:crossover junction endodeoxyribonuclease RuvC [Thermoanaerobaculia bacterium]